MQNLNVRKREKYNQLRNTLILHIDKEVMPDESLLRQLHQTIEGTEDSTREHLAVRLAQMLLAKGQMKESILCYLEALKRSPNHLALNSYYREHLSQVAGELESLSMREPESFQFRAVYELLRELGVVSLTLHLAAIEHYRRTGVPEKAAGIEEAMRVVAPNYIGLNQKEEK